LLKTLVDTSPYQALSVYRAITAIHAQVPAPTGWDLRPQRENRSDTGYVGLRNLGSTCYMNSLIQVLFMNAPIREHLLNDLRFEEGSAEELTNNVAFQLKKLFFSLKHRQKKYIVPTDWTFAFKDESGVNPMNVMLQQDAQEFLQQLAERFESCIKLKNNAVTTAAPAEDVLHKTFGGQLCNQMFPSPAAGENAATPREVREQNEGFVCISVAVKGCETLEKSLAKFVEGEQIAGYQWEEGQPRVNITKRQCIARMSDTLIFHLKRFELNFDTFRREKVNDAFAFPMHLNMYPYTKYGLEKAEGAHTGANGESALTEEDCEYELSGVVVHTGTTESGHYFAYLKEDSTGDAASKPRWLEFNDAEVTPFSEALLESECFGGTTKMHDIYGSGAVTTHEIPNPKSAYMLIYKRVSKKASLPITPALATASAEQAGAPTQASMAEMLYCAQINFENSVHRLSLRVLNEPHLAFYTHLMEALHKHAGAQNITLTSEQLTSFVHFTTQHTAHTAHISVFTEACKSIVKFLACEKALAQKESSKLGGAGSPAAQRVKRTYGTISSGHPPSSPQGTITMPSLFYLFTRRCLTLRDMFLFQPKSPRRILHHRHHRHHHRQMTRRMMHLSCHHCRRQASGPQIQRTQRAPQRCLTPPLSPPCHSMRCRPATRFWPPGWGAWRRPCRASTRPERRCARRWPRWCCGCSRCPASSTAGKRSPTQSWRWEWDCCPRALAGE
jgi:ubiquitin C-terminal hydrolase